MPKGAMNAHPVRFARLAESEPFAPTAFRPIRCDVAVMGGNLSFVESAGMPGKKGRPETLLRPSSGWAALWEGRDHSLTLRFMFFSVSTEVLCATEKMSETLAEPSSALAAVSFIAALTAEKPGM